MSLDSKLADRLARWSRWSHWRFPLLAFPFRRRGVARLAAHRALPEAVPLLVQCLGSADAKVAARAEAALRTLTDPRAADTLCTLWARQRDTKLGEIIQQCRYQATAPVGLRVLSGLQAGRLEELAREGAEAIAPLVAALTDADTALRPRAEQVLRSLSNPLTVDALCAAWAKNRDLTLGKLVAECRYQATAPVGLRVLSGLQAGWLEELAREGAEAIAPLLAALKENDAALASGARQVLETFVAADALVDHALDHGEGAVLLPIINARGLRHSIEGRWFLYLVLAGRFDDYLAADFEFQTLRAEFAAAPPELQARLRESIVRAGDTRMNALFVAEQKQAVLADLGDHDADLLVKLNARNRNWDALFRFLWVLPARRIRDAIAAMRDAKWEPDDPDRQALFRKLADWVPKIGEAPQTITSPVLTNPVLAKWLARGELEWAKKPEAELRGLLKEATPPPDQIAALGALRAQGRLTPEIVTAAGRSEHWLVRLVAVGFGASVEAAMKVNDGGIEWFKRLSPVLDAESVWGLKPCHVTRDGLEALQEGLANLPDRRVAGGLNLLEAVVAHYTAHDIEVEVGARVLISEDAFEISG